MWVIKIRFFENTLYNFNGWLTVTWVLTHMAWLHLTIPLKLPWHRGVAAPQCPLLKSDTQRKEHCSESPLKTFCLGLSQRCSHVASASCVSTTNFTHWISEGVSQRIEFIYIYIYRQHLITKVIARVVLTPRVPLFVFHYAWLKSTVWVFSIMAFSCCPSSWLDTQWNCCTL